MDIECVPNDEKTITDKGDKRDKSELRNIIQLSVVALDGNVIAHYNVNPEIQWINAGEYLNYTGKCWSCPVREVMAKAKRLLPFSKVMPLVLDSVHKALGNKVVFVAHNGGVWDGPILKRQMIENSLTFPFDVSLFDTQFVLKSFRRSDPSDRSWNLGYVYERAFGTKIENKHTSLADANALARLIRAYATDTKQTETELAQKWSPGSIVRGHVKDAFQMPDKPKPNKDFSEEDFKDMIRVLKEKPNPPKFTDTELEKLFNQMKNLSIV